MTSNGMAKAPPDDTVSFDVGGHIFKVRRSLLETHPNTILARSASEEWHQGDGKPIFIDRDSERFRYCLDYMRDGEVKLPPTEAKEALLKDLEYLGFDTVDPMRIKTNMLGIDALDCLSLCEDKMNQEVRELEEKRDYVRHAHSLFTNLKGQQSSTMELCLNYRSISNCSNSNDLYNFCAYRLKEDLMNGHLEQYGIRLVSLEKVRVSSWYTLTLSFERLFGRKKE